VQELTLKIINLFFSYFLIRKVNINIIFISQIIF